MAALVAILGFWLGLIGALLFAIALVRIVGVGGRLGRTTVIAAGVISSLLALVLWVGTGWQAGWILAIPLGCLLATFILLGTASHALQYCSPLPETSLRFVANEESTERLVQDLRRLTLVDELNEWPTPKPERSGPNRRHALFLILCSSVVNLGFARLIVGGDWSLNLLWAAIAGSICTLFYLAVSPMHEGWAVRREQLRRNPALRESIESGPVIGRIARVILIRSLRDQQRSQRCGAQRHTRRDQRLDCARRRNHRVDRG